MPNLAELHFAIKGCLRLLKFDRRAFDFFDRSAAGALRSFGVAAPLLVFYIWQFGGADIMPQDTDPMRYFSAMGIAYVYLWICFPLALLVFAELQNWQESVAGVICVNNWASLLVLLHSPGRLLELNGFSTDILAVLDFLALLYRFAVSVFIFRSLLSAGIPAAILLVLAEFMLSQAIILPAFFVMGTQP